MNKYNLYIAAALLYFSVPLLHTMENNHLIEATVDCDLNNIDLNVSLTESESEEAVTVNNNFIRDIPDSLNRANPTEDADLLMQCANEMQLTQKENKLIYGMPEKNYFAWFNANEQRKISRNKQARELSIMKRFMRETYNVTLPDNVVNHCVENANLFVKKTIQKKSSTSRKEKHITVKFASRETVLTSDEYKFTVSISKKHNLPIAEAFDMYSITKKLLQ